MIRKVFLFNIILIFSVILFSQEKDSLQTLLEVKVESKIPITKEYITKKLISKRNLGKDIPQILNNLQSTVSTSDAGNGIGYSGIRIRGSDASRINITLNGIPINDSESQSVFWVNMPDLASNLNSMEVQRGVGTSLNGAAAFGASVNLKVEAPSDSLGGLYAFSYGSFNSLKNTFQFNSGEIIKGVTTRTQLSFLQSDGYIDRASSLLHSYQFQLNYKTKNSEYSFYTLGGKEKTYQAWYGVDEATLQLNPTFNFAGAIYNNNGEVIDFYKNQTDNYLQNHYRLNWKYQPKENTILKTTIYYTKGKGYYEEYNQNQSLADYFIKTPVSASDLVRRKWINNDFYGITSQYIINNNQWDFILGITANQYKGNHFGRVISVQNIPNFPGIEYYRSLSEKNEVSGFIKAIYTLNKWRLYGDMQYRYINYIVKEKLHNDQEETINFNNNYSFINPKVGINYALPHGKLYFTYGLAQKEPTRTDLLANNTLKSEKLHDFELGINFKMNTFNFNLNLYEMLYQNQLVLTGKLDDVGNPIRENSGKSYRQGIEFAFEKSLFKKLKWMGNITLSQNKNTNFIYKNANLGKTDIAFSPNIISNLAIEFLANKTFSILLNNKYVSEQYLTNFEPKNGKLSSYFQTDLYCNYQTIFLTKNTLSFNFSIYNLFNTKIISNGYYYESSPYYYPQAGTHFLVGMNFNF